MPNQSVTGYSSAPQESHKAESIQILWREHASQMVPFGYNIQWAALLPRKSLITEQGQGFAYICESSSILPETQEHGELQHAYLQKVN